MRITITIALKFTILEYLIGKKYIVLWICKYAIKTSPKCAVFADTWPICDIFEDFSFQLLAIWHLDEKSN